MVFCAIPYFLEITDVGEAYLIFEIISVLLKVYSTNRPHRLKTQMCFAKQKCVLQNTNVFCQSKHICVLNQNTFVFCHTPDNCYHICTYCQQIIVSTMKDYLPPHQSPPLTLSAPRWRHCHRCHGCRTVAHIATITIAAATATAATVSPATSTVSASFATTFWLSARALPLLQQPLPTLALAAVGCRRNCQCRRCQTPLPPAPSAATR